MEQRPSPAGLPRVSSPPTAGRALPLTFLFPGRRVRDADFRRWDAKGLANPTNLAPGFISVSGLLTEKVYAFAGGLQLLACPRFTGEEFERVWLSDGERTTVASFPGLPSQTKLTFSPSRNRWDFSTANSWLDNSPLNEGAVGCADATWDQNEESPAPPVLPVSVSATLTLAENATDQSRTVPATLLTRFHRLFRP